MTTEQKYDCIFCKDIFDDKEALQIHFRKHGDPNFNKAANSKNRAQNDEASTDKSSEENEMVGCDVCEEVFTTISKAITHKHKVHPDHDAKYFCPFCGKVFTMKHLYNKHVQTNHEGESSSSTKDFYCECCEVAFFGAPAMLYHNKFFHRQDTELPAIGQSKKVKLYNQELLQIFYCAFCGEEYNNKVNLHKHMGDDHSDENQRPNDVMRCPLCEAIFYHLDAYEVHLTFHSIEDLYGEKNEVAEGVTEFSLETVPPIVEKVVDDQQLDGDPNAEGIDSFLQLVMGESETPEKVKVKKHKKHKKSKKASITLDEFLNMNKDVFGDGLDVQGIEEVPTPFVLKKPKVKKAANKVVNADLAKLKKIGITVKTKTGTSVVPNVKKNTPIKINSTLPAKSISKSNVQTSPNDIISKLMNQGNSQIKIVKKSVPQNIVTQSLLNASITESSENITESSDTNISDESLNKEESTNNEINKTENNMVENEIKHENEDDDINKKLHVSEVNNDRYCSENEGEFSDSDKISLNTINHEELESNTESESNTFKTFKNENFDNSLFHDTKDNGNTENIGSPKSSQNMSINSNCDQNGKDSSNKDFNTSEVHQGDDSEKEVDNVTNNTLSALKHLSHLLTVKSVNNAKNTNKPTVCSVTNFENKGISDNVVKETKPDQKLAVQYGTIKPSKSSPSVQSKVPSNAESEDDHPDPDSDFDNEETNSTENNDITYKNIIDKPNQVHSPSYQDKTLLPNQFKANSSIKLKEINDIKPEDCSKKMANLNILKRLTNVTAKPIANPNSQFNNKVNKTVSTPKINQKIINKGKIDDDIEVFNIDDSDSEDNEHTATNNVTEMKKNDVPLDTLKYLSKNITIKSNQQTNSKVTTCRAESSFENYTKFNKQTPEIQKSINLQNKLKNFGSHITVKARNTSPINKESNKNCFDEEADEQAYDSESDTVEKVKITEVKEEDRASDEDLNENDLNALVESPHASQSENEDCDENIDEQTSEIYKENAMAKQNNIIPPKKSSTGLESLKSLNKELTIKSLTKNCDTEENISQIRPKKMVEDTKNTAIKNTTNDQTSNKSMQQAGSSTSQSFNQKVSTSSNQVTKTVKRFQSQTVIEEITTTVTKTIRTVNQSTNEEVQSRSTSQHNPRPTIKPQKIMNRPPQPNRDYQSTAIRRVSPTVGTKIRNSGTAIRSPKPGMVRPSNQLVPLRSSSNLVRPAIPNSPGVRQALPPKTSPQRPAIGKLKISPHAISQTVKRPSDEGGNFSCFKKPKDNLIFPPEFQDNSDDESTTQFSASQSQTKFSSLTKTVKAKGGGVMAMQMKSEVSTSSQQQLNKLSNLSGLKIVKTNSSNKIEEKCEMTSAKKHTLEALEKLQKQGLLIKKPRIDEYNDPANSFSESDDEESEK